MKPILEWYEALPEPYRSQAIENYINKQNTIADAIEKGFDWSETKEGYMYWYEIHARALSGDFDKQK